MPFLVNSPQASLTTYGDVTLQGNPTITNTITENTIWSGGSVRLVGSATTECGDDCLGSNKNKINSDISDDDRQLSSLTNEQFFENSWGMDKATMQSSADKNITSITNLSKELDKDEYLGKTIWVKQTGDKILSLTGGTIGSAEKPVILVIDGDFKVAGNTTIYGIVYVTQDWTAANGTFKVNGAVVVEGKFEGNGTPDVIYDPLIFENIQKNNTGYVAKIPGGWRDF